MRYRLWVVGLLFTIPLGEGQLKPLEGAQYWIRSGMSLEILRAEISGAKCASSPEYLESCRAAFAEARKAVEPGQIKWSEDFDEMLAQIDRVTALKVPKQVLYGNMFNASLLTFDAHARLGPSAAFDNFMGAENGAHFGIGVVGLSTEAGLMVHEVYPHSPAAAAGLRVHDHLVEVNGQALGTGLEISKHSDLMLSAKPGEDLLFTVDRAGQRLKIKVTIGTINNENVVGELIEREGQKIAYIKLQRFKAEACAEVRHQLVRLLPKARAIILDLRDNPGGRLAEGVCVAGLFVGHKIIVGEKAVPVRVPLALGLPPLFGMGDRMAWHISEELPLAGDLPMTVLVDQLSASAAEIVAGALQDYQRAYVVGELSFGKGSVQTVRDFDLAGRFKIIYTTALFYRPSGETNQLAGVQPDFTVPFRFGASEAERQAPRERERFANSLRPSEGPAKPYVTARTDLGSVRTCMEKSGSATAVLNQFARANQVTDFQKATAVAVLGCSTPKSLQHNSSPVAAAE